MGCSSIELRVGEREAGLDHRIVGQVVAAGAGVCVRVPVNARWRPGVPAQDAASLVHLHEVQSLAARGFAPAQGRTGLRLRVDPHLIPDPGREQLFDDRQRLPNFEEQDPGSGQGVPLRLDEDFEVHLAVGRVGVIPPRVSVSPGRAPDGTDEVVLDRIVRGKDGGGLEPVDKGGSVLKQPLEALGPTLSAGQRGRQAAPPLITERRSQATDGKGAAQVAVTDEQSADAQNLLLQERVLGGSDGETG